LDTLVQLGQTLLRPSPVLQTKSSSLHQASSNHGRRSAVVYISCGSCHLSNALHTAMVADKNCRAT
jgi:hypothetical protein